MRVAFVCTLALHWATRPLKGHLFQLGYVHCVSLLGGSSPCYASPQPGESATPVRCRGRRGLRRDHWEPARCRAAAASAAGAPPGS